MMIPLLLAVALSAGNAEFDTAARLGALQVFSRRDVARLKSEGPAKGLLKAKMLADPSKYDTVEKARKAAETDYRLALDDEHREAVGNAAAKLGITQMHDGCFPYGSDADVRLFNTRFEEERKAACEEQAKTIAGAVRPSESEVETKDEKVLRAEMTGKVAARQKGVVFEENLKYISDTIVDPVIDSAKKEMKRQREYLLRTKCEAFAPSALGCEIEANLRKNVEERSAKEPDPAKAWGVFPKTLAAALPAAVEHRTLERVAKNVDDVDVPVDAESILKMMASDPAAHRTADGSEKIFRGVFAAQVLEGALGRAVEEAPAKEREEFSGYVRAHAASPEIVRAVETRIRREVLPKWRAARAQAAKAEADRIWPSLADRTWYPDAALADSVAARSDYAEAVKRWRTAPELEALAKQDGGRPVMEETAADADKAVLAAFDLARSAIAAQTAMVGEAEPAVLVEARERKSSFWRATPDLKAIVGMLTAAVEKKWDERRIETLWGDGERPRNAVDQHAALFPSVRRQIELVARSILEEMEKPEPEERPEEPPEEDPETASDSEAETPPESVEYTVVVRKSGDRIETEIRSGKRPVFERSCSARKDDFRSVTAAFVDKLIELLELK